jgi:hypothetical protein
MNYKLGKLPAVFDERTLRLENYLNVAKLPPLPETSDWFAKTSPFNMGGNDQYGDCVRVAAAHVTQTWTANAGREIITPDKMIIAEYLKLTGGADEGLVMLDFLKYWRNVGIDCPDGKHKIGAFAAIDPKNLISWRYTNYLFGSVFSGFILPQSAMDQFDKGQTWEVVKGSPTIGGHCVNGGIATPRLINLGTWARKQWATVNFVGQKCDEAYAIISLDWFNKNHVTPPGFHWKDLVADLKAVAG